MAEIETSEEQLKEQFVAELRALEESGAGLPFLLSPAEAWYLLAAVQLVLRHPGMQHGRNANTAEWLHAFGRNIQERLCQSPAMAQIAEMGWDARTDIV